MSFFEKVIEFASMVQVALSPIIIFTIIGIVCYFSIEQPMGLIVGGGLIVVGIILGAWYAIYIHKKRGATEFMSRISASPELDGKAESEKKEKK